MKRPKHTPLDLRNAAIIFAVRVTLEADIKATSGNPNACQIVGALIPITELTSDDPLFANGQLFRFFFDADHNSETGQRIEGIIGAELKITLGDYHGEASLHYFDGPGNWIEEKLIPIDFLGDGFALTMPEGSIPSTPLDVYRRPGNYHFN